jgi:hypothetical protein
MGSNHIALGERFPADDWMAQIEALQRVVDHRADHQPGSVSLQHASANVKFEAPRAATKIRARRSSPVAGSTTAMVSPAQ